MIASAERPPQDSPGEPPLGPRWRASRARAQEQVLPSGAVTVSCTAAIGEGGLGRHLGELLDGLERRGSHASCLCGAPRAGAPARPCREVRPHPAAAVLTRAMRRSPAWRLWGASVGFDRRAARELGSCEHLIAFSGQALGQLRAARGRGLESVSLVSPTAHLRGVVARYAQAHRQYPLEGSWAARIVGRGLAEYAIADRILVSSAYVWSSFVEEGVPEESLALFPLTPDPRFRPAPQARQEETFEVVYVGGLSVVKGVPLLVEAIRRLPERDLRLKLLGGWETRGMRRFIERSCEEDDRISVQLGDPLAHLQRARLYVHPSYEDGFSYSSAEALACGVPVVASENTGMKELIEPGRTGAITPTGDLDALTEAIQAAYRGELLGG